MSFLKNLLEYKKSMNQTKVSIYNHSSVQIEFSNLVLSARNISQEFNAIIVAGYPGLPNITKKLFTGEAFLFETIDSGILEIRLFSINYDGYVDLLISQVSPQIGIQGGFVEDDYDNQLFSREDIEKIKESIKQIKNDLPKLNHITPEQFDLLNLKLDDIQNASQRLGQKDWIMYIMGSLTSFCMSVALATEATKDIFITVNTAFKWLFKNASLLI